MIVSKNELHRNTIALLLVVLYKIVINIIITVWYKNVYIADDIN